MTNLRVPALANLTTLNGNDILYVVDVSDVSQDPSGTSYHITVNDLRNLLIQTGFNLIVTPTNYSATVDDQIIVISGTSVTVMLPNASAVPAGKRLYVKCKVAPVAVNVTAAGGLIDDESEYKYSSKGELVTFVSDGTDWLVL